MLCEEFDPSICYQLLKRVIYRQLIGRIISHQSFDRYLEKGAVMRLRYNVLFQN